MVPSPLVLLPLILRLFAAELGVVVIDGLSLLVGADDLDGELIWSFCGEEGVLSSLEAEGFRYLLREADRQDVLGRLALGLTGPDVVDLPHWSIPSYVWHGWIIATKDGGVKGERGGRLSWI